MLVTGVALAALGQFVSGRSLEGRFAFLHGAAGAFRGIYPNPQTMVLAVALLATGGVLFAVGAWLLRRDEGETVSAESIGWPPLPGLALAAIAIGPFAYLLLNLSHHKYREWYPYLLVASVSAFAVFWALKRPIRFKLSRPPRTVYVEVGVVALITGVFVALNVRDLTSWLYSANGDEYSFFVAAHEIGHGVTHNLFSQTGVYSNHPWLTSAYQAMVMKVLGFDQFGWRMTSVLSAAAVIPPLYLLVRMLFGVRVGLFSATIFAASHYILDFAHYGYDNLFPLFPTVLALCLLVFGLRRRNALALFGAGCAAGLGFYTFYSSRAAIVIIGLYLITLGRRGLRPQVVLPVGVGFLLLVAPMLVVNRLDVFRAMGDQSLIGYDQSFVGEISRHLRENVPIQMLAFNVNQRPIGSLLDPVSAVLAVLGLIYASIRVRHGGQRLLVIWFVIGITATGLFFPKPGVAETRLMYMVPVMAVLAGLALDRALAVFPPRDWPRPAAATVLQGTFAVAVLAAVVTLNLYRFWHEIPLRAKRSPEAVAMRALFSPECQSPALIVGQFPDPLLKPVVSTYALGDRTPRIASFEQVLDAPNFSVGASCVILMPEDDKQSDQVLAQLKTGLGTYNESRMWDIAGITYVDVLTRR